MAKKPAEKDPMIKIINSIQNPLIKTIAALAHKKDRIAHRAFIAEGLTVCQTLLEGGFILRYLVVNNANMQLITRLIKNQEQKAILASDEVFKKISQSQTPSGILGVFEMKENPSMAALGSGLICYQLQDPGNVGTLMRSCAAMGKKSVVLIESVDPYNPKVVQASAGMIAHLDIFNLSLEKLREHANRLKLNVCALVVQGGRDASEINFANTLLMVGNEARGLDKQALKNSDSMLSLAMPGGMESLNVAVAGSIALYLAAQQEDE